MSTKMSLISAGSRGLVIIFEEVADSFAHNVGTLDYFIGNYVSGLYGILSELSDKTAFS